MRKLASILVSFAFVVALGSCKPGVAMWSDCTGSDDKTATDSTYVLVCKDGVWQPIMTVGEFVRIKRGQQVTIAPLPTRPTTTTTSTTPSTSTTAAATTTTGGPTTSTTSTTAGPTTTTTASTTTTTLSPTPTLSGVSPASGPIAGGTSVTLTGTNFTGTTVVTFGGTPATYTVNSATQITAITPAHSAGSVNVVVTKPSGDGSLFNIFTYV